jgi:hypothetical protein
MRVHTVLLAEHRTHLARTMPDSSIHPSWPLAADRLRNVRSYRHGLYLSLVGTRVSSARIRPIPRPWPGARRLSPVVPFRSVPVQSTQRNTLVTPYASGRTYSPQNHRDSEWHGRVASTQHSGMSRSRRTWSARRLLIHPLSSVVDLIERAREFRIGTEGQRPIGTAIAPMT